MSELGTFPKFTALAIDDKTQDDKNNKLWWQSTVNTIRHIITD